MTSDKPAPGAPFERCTRGFIPRPGDVLKGYCCVGEILVFVPDDQATLRSGG